MYDLCTMMKRHEELLEVKVMLDVSAALSEALHRFGMERESRFQERISRSRPVKYGFKMRFDQFGRDVAHFFEDDSEEILIDHFEKVVLTLRGRGSHSMLELGSNQCFYSILFNKILSPARVVNLMVEPNEAHMARGRANWDLNELRGGVFINKLIKNPIESNPSNVDVGPVGETSVDELLAEHGIEDLDVLHCDIDGAEAFAFKGAVESLSQKKINKIFLLTHPNELRGDLHAQLKKFITEFGYTLLVDLPGTYVGGDGLIVAER